MIPPEIIGFVAAILTTGSFIPQVLKAHRTKSTKDLSFGSFSSLALGMFLWLVYGYMISALAVLVGNTFSLVLTLDILYLKLKYDTKLFAREDSVSEEDKKDDVV